MALRVALLRIPVVAAVSFFFVGKLDKQCSYHHH